jgi:KaiC/GvpD/RAD55 family RecA-like ATPase
MEQANLERIQNLTDDKAEISSSKKALMRSLLSAKVRTLLIKGEPGTGKTTLALELLREFGRGVYVSSRVSGDMLLEQNRQMSKLVEQGFVTSLSVGEASEKKLNYKFEDFRLASIEDVLMSILGRSISGEETLIILDSWDSIASKLEAKERIKTEQSLLVIAEANKVKLIFVSEDENMGVSDYFVDAVIKLEDLERDGMRVRQIVWKKLRGSRIPRRASLYTLDDGKFTICEPTRVLFPGEYPEKPFPAQPNTKAKYSSGSADLDHFLDGGYRKGSTILLELDHRIGPTWHVPFIVSAEMNFLSNGFSMFILPSGNRPPQTIKENLLPYFSEDFLKTSLRIAQYDLGGFTDPCFVQLEKGSPDKHAAAVMKQIEIIKGESKRPCIFFIGMDSVQSANAREMIDPLGFGLTETVRRTQDLAIVTLKQGSALGLELNNRCDLHLKLEEFDRTLTIHSVKPPSELYHMEYDYSPGYGMVKLRPIV